MGNDTIVASGQTTPEQQRLGRRRLQRRRCPGHELGRAGADAAGVDPGVPGADQHVRRRVRPGERRRRQRRDQDRHQPVQGRGVRVPREQRVDLRGLLRQDEEPGQADNRKARVGRGHRRTDRQEQGALLLQPGAPGGQPEPDARVRHRGRTWTSRSPRIAPTGTRWSGSITRSTRITAGPCDGSGSGRRSGTPSAPARPKTRSRTRPTSIRRRW